MNRIVKSSSFIISSIVTQLKYIECTCITYEILLWLFFHSVLFSVALLTRLAAVNFDTDSTPMRVLIKADWSDNNSTLAWKTPNDIRSFHLQVCRSS